MKQSKINRKFERMTGVYNARQENEYHLPLTNKNEMSIKDVQDGNKLIAEFMGEKWRVGDAFGETKPFVQIDNKKGYWVTANYDSDWNWLMAVILKIHDECKYYSHGLAFFEGLTIFSTIEQVYEAVFKFLDWYNEVLIEHRG